MVFYGEYTLNITDGGRLVIPKKIRENLTGDYFILTKGFNNCLSGYDKEEWNTKTANLMNQTSLLDTDNIDKKRFIFSGANQITIDDQGRFVLPKSLTDFMGLTDEKVVIVGVGDHFEIWGMEKWEKYLKTINLS